MTATSSELDAFWKAGPLFTSVTSPTPMIPQRINATIYLPQKPGYLKIIVNLPKNTKGTACFESEAVPPIIPKTANSHIFDAHKL